MPLESASYISDLAVSYPAPTDLVRQTDDHIRLIKAVLKSTFPNLDGPVTSTPEQLSTPPFVLPIGLISVWYGSAGTVPSGWAICNGQMVNKSDGSGTIVTPDLRDKTVIGAGGTLAAQGVSVGSAIVEGLTAPGGEHSHVVAAGGAHSHNVTVAGHALTIGEMPAHTHTMITGSGGSSSYSADADSGSSSEDTGQTGGGAPHGHPGSTADAAAAHTHAITNAVAHTHAVAASVVQPSMGLHYIMKV